jgi:hypothetical protein
MDGFDESVGVSGRLTDHVGIGVLTRLLHRDLVDEVLVETGRVEQRVRLLPARVVVYFVLALCLFFGESYEEVIRRLVHGLKFLGNWSDEWTVPTAGALTRARGRLGAEPIRELFERVAVPLAQPGTRGGWLRGFRLMSIDGSTLDVADTTENDDEFGRPCSGSVPGPFPQARIVGLGECGTRAVVAARFGPYRVSENELADQLLPYCEPGMLVLADRNFFSHKRWKAFRETGAELLWRVQENVALPCLEWFPDGSYRSVIATSKARDQAARLSAKTGARVEPVGQPVRVIEYQITNRKDDAELICLITTIVDPGLAPAHELAAAYHDRWEMETTLGEIKTTQRGPGRVLRSKSPELVRQEIWALLLTHYAISDLRREAADDIDEPPQRIAFIRTLRIVRRQVTDQAGFSPSPTPEGNPRHA